MPSFRVIQSNKYQMDPVPEGLGFADRVTLPRLERVFSTAKLSPLFR